MHSLIEKGNLINNSSPHEEKSNTNSFLISVTSKYVKDIEKIEEKI